MPILKPASILLALCAFGCSDSSKDQGDSHTGKETGGTDSGDTQDTGVAASLVSLGSPEVLVSGLETALHIMAIEGGRVVISESREAPATRGRVLVAEPDGSLHELVSDVPLVHFTHDVTYMGPNGMTLLPGGQEMLWALFLGAGDVTPVEEDPDWDPDAGTNVLRVPLYGESGDLAETTPASELEVWTNVPHTFLYDLAWGDDDILIATEPGQNAVYFFENGSDGQPVTVPLPEIEIQPVNEQPTVESVPTGLAISGGLALVGHLGGGLVDEYGNPTGQPFDQLVGRVSRMEPEGPEVVVDHVYSVLDVVALETGEVLLVCFDYYGTNTHLLYPGQAPDISLYGEGGFIYQLMPNGSMREVGLIFDFPVSASSSGSDFYVVTMGGDLLRYPVSLEQE
jgi:hypothetical protein